MSLKYNVLIIGAGNIGAFFDHPRSRDILTHAHAFTKNTHFNLVGFVDRIPEKAKRAARVWGCQPFDSIEDAFRHTNIDIAIVSVPDAKHYDVLKQLAKFSLRLVFTEKPLALSLEEAEEIIRVFGSRKTAIAVNYSRRFLPEFEKIKNNINAGKYGNFLTGSGYYGKGLLHNGSHLVDLIMYFLGDIKKVKPIGEVSDFLPKDKTISAVLTLRNNKHFFLQAIDSRKYTLFEADFLFEKNRIRICDLGLKIESYGIMTNSIFRGYKNIVKISTVNTSLYNALYYAAQNIYDYLSFKEKLKCSVEDAYKTLRACITVRENLMK